MQATYLLIQKHAQIHSDKYPMHRRLTKEIYQHMDTRSRAHFGTLITETYQHMNTRSRAHLGIPTMEAY